MNLYTHTVMNDDDGDGDNNTREGAVHARLPRNVCASPMWNLLLFLAEAEATRITYRARTYIYKYTHTYGL